MARKQKAKVFSKFLDLIGIVDTAEQQEQDDDFNSDFDSARPRGRSAAKSKAFDNDFDQEPRLTHIQSRRERPAANSAALANDQFDAEEGWGDAFGRPEYGARTQQRAQSKNRPSVNRYSGEQKNASARSVSRHENYSYGDEYYKGSSGYQSGDQKHSYRSNSSAYAGYGASSRRYDDPESYYGSAAQDHYAEADHSNQQRHQTVIFKLHSVDECKGVIMALIEKKSVLLNLDELDSLQAQRTLDTMSGATFAIGARLSRASDRTWLITPSTVDVNDKQNDAANDSPKYSGRYY